MGGAESLLTGLNALNRFAWIGAFSSGGLTEGFKADFPGLDAKANRQLRLLWIACGTDDRLIDINRKFRDWLKSKGIQHTDVGTPGALTWMVWRRNLASFAPLLFQKSVPSASGFELGAKEGWTVSQSAWARPAEEGRLHERRRHRDLVREQPRLEPYFHSQPSFVFSAYPPRRSRTCQ
jgi:hypothetical protein